MQMEQRDLCFMTLVLLDRQPALPRPSRTTVLLIHEKKTPNVVRATPTKKQQPMWLLSSPFLSRNHQGTCSFKVVVPELMVTALRILEFQLLFLKTELWQEHFKISHIFQKQDSYSRLLTQQPSRTPELQAQLEPAASADIAS